MIFFFINLRIFHPKVLKECAAELAEPLTILFVTTMKEGKIPQQWKEANITPVYKKESRSEVENYRPISLTFVCCKVMERLVKNAVLNHMISSSYLSDYQHGFVQGRSCTTQKLMFVYKLTDILDQGFTRKDPYYVV